MITNVKTKIETTKVFETLLKKSVLNRIREAIKDFDYYENTKRDFEVYIEEMNTYILLEASIDITATENYVDYDHESTSYEITNVCIHDVKFVDEDGQPIELTKTQETIASQFIIKNI